MAHQSTSPARSLSLPTETVINHLKGSLRAQLIQPGDPTYDGARNVYNAIHDRRPALIVQASGVADVMAAVGFAREHSLDVAVRGGGHSVSGFGTCNGGIVIDLQRMRGIRVDPERKTVRAEGGCTWGDLNHATHAFGLATTGGVVSTTGIAGLTLGGGMGYLARSCGLSCDNLISADMVLANGRFVTCSEDREPELFWAIRGGGGNFGVVTSFEFRLHAIGDIVAGVFLFPLDGEAARHYRRYIAGAPEEMGAICGFSLVEPLPFVPEAWHHKPVTAVVACWSGAIDEGESRLEELRTWGPLVGAMVQRFPYPVVNTLFDALVPAGLQQYWKGAFTRELTDGAIGVHLEHAARTPTLQSSTLIFPINGACHRVAGDATAFAGRHATFSTVISGAWPDAADNARNIAWVRDYDEALRPFSDPAGYVNFMDDDDGDRVAVNYAANYARLAEIKRQYDPGNLFHLNQNIKPAA